jgi:hypothetical protein
MISNLISGAWKRGFLVTAIFILSLAGCATTHDRLFDTDTSQVQLRSIQTRAFDTTDKEKTLRAVIATLQDLGLIIEKADSTLGLVTATKHDLRLSMQGLKMTVTVRQRGESQVLVRANIEHGLRPVTTPQPYQQFFTSLEKSLFLQAHEVD